MPFIWKSRIRFSDTDATGRIHYAAIFRHLDTAEEEFFRDLGRPYTADGERETSWPRVHVEADFSGALRFADEIDIEVYTERTGKASFTLGFKVTKEGAEVVRGRYVIAAMDIRTQKSTPLPAEVLDLLRRRMRE